MANSEAGTSNNPVQALRSKYQVFLSFRGSDTRYNFTDFLYHNLINAGVRVFKDEDELQEGEVIGDTLLDAINNSVLYIPIFSQNYASSKWCLRELALMVDNVSKSEGKKSILPIFLYVEPADVKLKTPLSPTLLEHEKKFPNEVKDWRKALEEVDHIKGWNVKMNQSQAVIVESVVEKVVKKLEIKQKSVTENLIGLDDRVKDLIELLDVNEYDVRLAAIYGMGGIGKTTIAKVIFNQLSFHFGKFCSFIEDIRESSSTKEGIVRLQKKLLSDITGSSIAETVMDREEGMRMIEAALCTKKILVVLDDVAEERHIKNLIINCSLCLGSRIIITTRDKTIPLDAGFNGEIIRYEVLKMDDALALQLFRQHAFAKDFPLNDYGGLSSEIVSIMGGLPLAIEVVGSLLKGKKEEFWKETLAKLKKEPEEEILKKLRISYDDLDKYQKQIFLDIACFFFNKKKINAIYMWADCSLYPERGIDVLTSRCLIKILDDDKFWMHDQLIDMGRQIVREENQDDPGERSRLWIAKDALQIIGTKEEKHKVQALEISTDGPPLEIRNENFKRLSNLRFLDLKMGTYVGDFAGCHSKLRWFSWSDPLRCEYRRMDNFVLDFKADNLYLDQLVVCELNQIHFKDDSKVWNLIKRTTKLKVLSLTQCNGITTIPDISICSNLERLTLVACSQAKRIEGFIGDLQSLIELKIEGCYHFMDLPEEVGALVNLKHLSLSYCKCLRELPSSLGNLTSLTELDLSGTNIGKFPDFIVQLKSLQILRFPFHCSFFGVSNNHDWQLTNGISTLVKLEELNLSGHGKLKGEIPVGIGECSSLRILNLAVTSICRIPSTINKLHHLQSLNLISCHKVQELPELPTSLTHLFLCSKSLLSIPNLLELTNLVELQLSDTSKYTGKSKLISGCDLSWIGRLFRLKCLELNLLNVPAPPELTSLSHLEKLVLTRLDLKPLAQVLSSDRSWRNLSTLKITHFEVEELPLDGLSRLERLVVGSCKRLQRLAIPLELRKLQDVIVFSCSDLVEIQIIGVLKPLKDLNINYCDSLTRISGLSYLKNLNRLEIGWCIVLTNVDGLNELESLKILLVSNCLSLRWLIDASCTKIPNDCVFHVMWCGNSIKNSVEGSFLLKRISWKQYREEILLNASNKISFTIQFQLGGKERRRGSGIEFVGGVKREKEVVDPESVTYGGLIADVKDLVFPLERIWCKIYDQVHLEIKCDDDVKYMVQLAARRRILLIRLFVEGTMNLKRQRVEMLPNLLNKGKRQRDDDHASHTNTTTKNSACGQQSGIPQQVTRRTTRQAAKKQTLVEAVELPAEAAGPSTKNKKNDSKQVSPRRRSARLMKGPTGEK